MFSQRKNKRYNYKPRLGKNADLDKRELFKENWDSKINTNSKRGSFFNTLVWLIIALALVLFLMYYLETKN